MLPTEAAQPGATVWVAACWLDRKLQPGAAADPRSARIRFGYLLAA